MTIELRSDSAAIRREAKAGAFRAGDWVEVRPIADVLAMLDGRGRLAGLPFMPEMAKYCGRRFRVFKSAHKTCDPTGQTNMRRMEDAVHLDTRCDGGAHDGCEARCLLYWKTAWLKRVNGPLRGDAEAAGEPAPDLQPLLAATRYADSMRAVRYRCQATEITRATSPLSSRDMRQYAQDIATGNISIPHFARYFAVAAAKAVGSRLPRLAGPLLEALPASGASSNVFPPLDLKPGDLVQVRSASEIELSLDGQGKNRGLALEREMLRYCGGTYRVAYRVGRIIDEATGRMLKLERDCIVLEGLTCAGLENRGRLFCPRSSYFYWREAWLRRLPERKNPAGAGSD